MAHESITLWGYRTGGLETADSIRNGFAFDLTQLDLSRRKVLSAALHLRGAGRSGVASVALTDPAEESVYGGFDDGTLAPSTLRIPLSLAALQDLRDAGGAFFAVSAVVRDAAGRPQRLPADRSRQALVLTVAEAAGLAAA